MKTTTDVSSSGVSTPTSDRSGRLPKRLKVHRGNGAVRLRQTDTGSDDVPAPGDLVADLPELLTADGMSVETLVERPRSPQEIAADLKVLRGSPDRCQAAHHLAALLSHEEAELAKSLEVMDENEEILDLVEQLPEERLKAMQHLLTGKRSEIEHKINAARDRHRGDPSTFERVTAPFREVMRMVALVLKAIKRRIKELRAELEHSLKSTQPAA